MSLDVADVFETTSRKYHKVKRMYILYIALAIFALSAILASQWVLSYNDTTYTVVVTEKERIVDNKGKSKYMIYCKDAENEIYVFENTDNLIRGKWNSSDYYAVIQTGAVYQFTVIGIRVPILSMYQNILIVDSAPLGSEENYSNRTHIISPNTSKRR